MKRDKTERYEGGLHKKQNEIEEQRTIKMRKIFNYNLLPLHLSESFIYIIFFSLQTKMFRPEPHTARATSA